MTSVLLDGPFAGMTTEEYEAMRGLDCQIAERVGWVKDGETHWRYEFPFAGVCPFKSELRDESGGVPFFSSDMNGAYLVLAYALTVWRYSAKQIFFDELQKLACETDDKMAMWPDALISLTPDLPLNICKAFVNAAMWMTEHNMDPINASAKSKEYAATVEYEDRVYEDDGVQRTYRKAKLKDGQPPWVH